MLGSRANPLLVLLAGHGGCGTVASTLALSDVQKVSDLIDGSKNSQGSTIGEGRVFALVEVDRKKPSLESIDDMSFDRQKGWRWALDE